MASHRCRSAVPAQFGWPRTSLDAMSVDIGGVVLSPRTPRVIVPIMGRDLAAIAHEADLIAATDADLVEWRADRFDGLTSADAVQQTAGTIRRIVARPVIVTVRSAAEGGFFAGDADAYAAAVTSIGDSADAIDVELRHPLAEGLMRAAAVPVIASCHFPHGTPDEATMVALLQGAESTPAAIAKLAVLASSPADAAALLHATATCAAAATKPVITMAMGDHGVITRLIGHEFGSCATFATVAQASAPGQPSLARLRQAWAALDGYTCVDTVKP